MGFPVDYELGRALLGGAEKRRAIHEGCKNYTVKLECVDGGRNTIGFFNGFMYRDGQPLILTAGHIVGWNGTVTCYAIFLKGTPSESRHELKLLRTGRYVRDATRPAADGSLINFKIYDPDVALFEVPAGCGALPAHLPRPYASMPRIGDTAYVVGFKGTDEPQLSIFDGTVSYVPATADAMLLTAYVDDGLSGSPVFNGDGYVIGMVTSGDDGHTTQQAKALPTCTISGWLRYLGQPVFNG